MKHNRSALSFARRRGGQTLVEAAFVVGVLLLLSMGLVQFGLIFNARVTLTHLARDGTRFASVHGRDQTTIFNGTVMNTDDAIVANIRQQAAYTEFVPSDLIVTVNPPQTAPGNPPATARSTGMPITVVVSYDMHKKMFMPPDFIGLSNYGPPGTTYPSEATMLIE